ncbi:MAG TPA: phosphate/phosphite/phosphonate ABC transporter substrate-binding protein [Nitrospirae bacterium]|nr:phosphate/phosphite/phosphonate ABC transporter substrate-binding protein [Nitrospirota bacterium]
MMKYFAFITKYAAIILSVLSIAIVSEAAPSKQLTMLLIPLRSPSAMYRDFLPLKRYIEGQLNIKIRLRVAQKSSDVVKELKNGNADIAYLCPTLYCRAFETANIEPLVRIRIDGKSSYRSVLLVRKDSPIRYTADLIDKTFVYGRYACPGSGLLPEIMLTRIGITDNDFFDVVKLGSDESALTAVMAKMFDATAVPETVAGPFMKNGLRDIRYSNPIPQYLFVARKSLGKALIKKLRNIMIGINSLENPGSMIGGIEKGTDGFDIAEDGDYDIVRLLMRIVDNNSKFSSRSRKDVVRFVVEPEYFVPDMFTKLTPLIEYLSERTGRRFQLIMPSDTDAFVAMQEKGDGDFFFGSIGILTHNKAMNLLGNIWSISINNISGERRGVIIVKTGSGIKSVKGLYGKKIGITSLYSDDGYKSQLKLLEKSGVPAGAIDFVKLNTYENVVKNVYEGSVDAGFINETVLYSLRKDLDVSKIAIIDRTPKIKGWILVSRDTLDNRLIKRVTKYITEYNPRLQ